MSLQIGVRLLQVEGIESFRQRCEELGLEPEAVAVELLEHFGRRGELREGPYGSFRVPGLTYQAKKAKR